MSQSWPYQLGERIGGGAFCEVFAVPERGGVLKVPRPQARLEALGTGVVFNALGFRLGGGPSDPWVPEPAVVLRRETEALRRISSPAFPKVLASSNETRAVPWLLLKRIEGHTWRHALNSTPPTLAHFSALLAALVEVNASGKLSCHGDIKPENLMLTPSGKVVILDPSSGCATRSASGAIEAMLTTEWYNPAFSSSDVFSLGVLLCELVTGQNCLLSASARIEDAKRRLGPELTKYLSHAREAGHASPVLQRLSTMDLPREMMPTMSERLETIILKCMMLRRDGDALELTSPYESVAALHKVVSPEVRQ
jgi:serine/threonine protein kinase